MRFFILLKHVLIARGRWLAAPVFCAKTAGGVWRWRMVRGLIRCGSRIRFAFWSEPWSGWVSRKRTHGTQREVFLSNKPLVLTHLKGDRCMLHNYFLCVPCALLRLLIPLE